MLALAFISEKILIKSITIRKKKMSTCNLLIEIFSNSYLLVQYFLFNNTLHKIIQKELPLSEYSGFPVSSAHNKLPHKFYKNKLTTYIDKRNSFYIWYNLHNVTILYNKHDIKNRLAFSQKYYKHESISNRDALSYIRVHLTIF